MHMLIRLVLAFVASPIMAATGFRFTKDYRWGVTTRHALTYALVNVVAANMLADVLAPSKESPNA